MTKHEAGGLALFAATIACAAFGCSTTSTSGARSGVNESAALASITDDDRGRLCDWIAAQAGGYANATTAVCDGGVELRATFVQDRASCVAKLATATSDCDATVSQIEDCVSAEIAAGPCGLAEGTPAACTQFNMTACGGAPGST